MKTSSSISSFAADPSLISTLSSPRLEFLTDQIGGKLVNDDAFVASISEKLFTVEILNQISRAVTSKASDPFDSIYIANLKPDIIDPAVLEEIEHTAGIVDVSSSVIFSDDLD